MNTPTTAAPPASSNRGLLLVIVGLVVAGLALVALVATRSNGESVEPVAAVQTGAVSTEGAVLANLPDGVSVGVAANDPVVGQVAPTLEGTNFAEETVTISADGKPKAVYFLAHWCPHCQDEVPAVQKLIDDGAKPEELEIYAVSTAVDTGRGNYPPQSWLASEGLAATVVRDDEAASAFSAFGGTGFPYVVYLDGENKVVARSAGNLDPATITELWELAATPG